MSVGSLLTGASVQGAAPWGAARLGVCHLASGDRWGGAEVQVATLLHALAGRQEFQLFTILLNEGRLAEETRRSGIEVMVVPENRNSFLQILSRATDHLRAKPVSILHSHRYKENLLATLLAWRCRVPYLVRTQHGLREPFQGLKDWKHRSVLWADRQVARFSTDAVIAVSAGVRDHLLREVGPRKLVLIPNGVEVDRIQPSLPAAEVRRRLSIPAACSLVGTAGRLEPVKRLDLFLQAAGHLARLEPRAHFLLLGEGSQEAQLRRLCSSLELEDRVHFLGHRDDVYDWLAALDIFLLCSDREGLPIVLLEALCLGAAVVARKVAGVTEVIQDQVSGLLVDEPDPAVLAQGCLRLLRDDTERRRLAATGRAQVLEHFQASQNAAAVAHLYRALGGGR